MVRFVLHMPVRSGDTDQEEYASGLTEGQVGTAYTVWRFGSRPVSRPPAVDPDGPCRVEEVQVGPG
jgi:hypothetical protein